MRLQTSPLLELQVLLARKEHNLIKEAQLKNSRRLKLSQIEAFLRG